jgi:hypothetical protein
VDTGLVELEQGNPAHIAARIQAEVSSENLQQWHQGTPADWALESLAIVRAQVYPLPSSGEISASYIESGRAVIRTRLAQASRSEAGIAAESDVDVNGSAYCFAYELTAVSVRD